MKLAEDALIRIIEILRQGLMESRDISDLLKALDLEPNESGRLAVSRQNTDWSIPPATD